MNATHNDLTTGNISSKIIKVAIPIMASSFIAMAYNITDMFWLGNVGTGAVAAVGTAGFFIWFIEALLSFPKFGVEIFVAQSVGADKISEAKLYAKNALFISIFSALVLSLIIGVFAPFFISLFNLKEQNVVSDAITYLRIFSIVMVSWVPMNTMSGIYNGIGKSKIPFVLNSIGLGLNIILDPIFIYGLHMGAVGAGIASLIASFIALGLYLYFIFRVKPPFENFTLKGKVSIEHIYKISKVGLPPSLHHAGFAVISMFIARIVSSWGATAIAVQSLGAQIESIAWMTAGGLSTALSAFVGQNVGAKKIERIKKGYYFTISLSCGFGIISALILYFFGENIYTVFMPNDSLAVELGVLYFTIMAYSQVFMCVEITTAGAFNGFSKSIPPAIVGFGFTLMRIPLAIILSKTSLELSGIWWSITITSWIKGVVIVGWFYFFFKKVIKKPEFPQA